MPVPTGTKPDEREKEKKKNDRVLNLALCERVRVANFIQSRPRFVTVSHFDGIRREKGDRIGLLFHARAAKSVCPSIRSR